jgi:hypothetical protein
VEEDNMASQGEEPVQGLGHLSTSRQRIDFGLAPTTLDLPPEALPALAPRPRRTFLAGLGWAAGFLLGILVLLAGLFL